MNRRAQRPAFLVPTRVKRDFAPVRAQVMASVAACPKTITLEVALAQVALFQKAR